MAEPLTPLQRYLRVQKSVDRDLARVLLDAARDGEGRVVALAGRDGVSAAVGRAQYARAVRELRRTSAALWGRVLPVLVAGLLRSGQAAADAENAQNRLLFGTAAGETVRALERSLDAQAQNTVRAYIAKNENGIPLSSQVYTTRALADGWVDREIARSILLGESWSQLAKRVTHLIRPTVPGGVSYAAKRLGRTELNNAFHRAQIDQRADSPFTKGFQWHLSGSHPRRDACNDYAERTHSRGGEPGVFTVASVPGKPHPNCLCYLTTVLVSDRTFYSNLKRGRYDDYLSTRTGRSFRP